MLCCKSTYLEIQAITWRYDGVFKITHNIYDAEVSPNLSYYSKSNARGNKYKLLNHMFHYDLRKHSFSTPVVNIWNSLPNFVVDVDTVCRFMYV